MSIRKPGPWPCASKPAPPPRRALSYKCPRALARLMRQLGQPTQRRVCYEAGLCDYVLYWQLSRPGFVQPSGVRQRPGGQAPSGRTRRCCRLCIRPSSGSDRGTYSWWPKGLSNQATTGSGARAAGFHGGPRTAGRSAARTEGDRVGRPQGSTKRAGPIEIGPTEDLIFPSHEPAVDKSRDNHGF